MRGGGGLFEVEPAKRRQSQGRGAAADKRFRADPEPHRPAGGLTALPFRPHLARKPANVQTYPNHLIPGSPRRTDQASAASKWSQNSLTYEGLQGNNWSQD